MKRMAESISFNILSAQAKPESTDVLYLDLRCGLFRMHTDPYNQLAAAALM